MPLRYQWRITDVPAQRVSFMPIGSLDDLDSTELEKEWDALQNSLSKSERMQLAAIVRSEAPHLVEHFYAILQSHEKLSDMLPDGLVESRLVHTLTQWLLALFPQDQPPAFEAMMEQQLKVGSVHARIGLPVQYVNHAWRILAEDLQVRILKNSKTEAMMNALLRVVSSTLNIAFEIMSAGYNRDTTRAARSEEAYRLYSLGQNLSQEREAQRAALAEWTQNILFSIAADHYAGDRTALAESEFGLWVTHRGNVIFEGMAELEKVNATISEIDKTIMPDLTSGQNPATVLVRLQARVNEIKALLGECFAAATRLEGGHDPQTRMLNRRFMETILMREVSYARKMHRPLSIIMVDIDHFKSINDRFGHAGGDLVLQACAKRVLDLTRIGDFVFRYGGEEFLIALVETGVDDALNMAERIRSAFECEAIAITDEQNVNITASIGIAEFKGHPDYQELVKSADEMLYRAKQAGRNRVEIARNTVEA